MEQRPITPESEETLPATSGAVAGHDIFQDPALSATLKDDPLFLFLRKWWVQIAVAAGALVLGVYAKGAFEDTHHAEMGRAADVFVDLDSRFQEIVPLQVALEKAIADEAKAGDKKEDAAKKVAEARTKLEQGKAQFQSALTSLSDTKEPYQTLGKLYRGAAAARDGDAAGAAAVLSTTAWTGIKDAQSPERFFAEVSALILARSQLDQPDNLTQARATLKNLAVQGSFMDIAAGLALASASQTSEERAEARAALETIRSHSPEQSEAIDSALERFGR